jgi:hypothetical protein
MKQSIVEKIQQRRLQILVHSCIYYKYDTNIVTDAKWNEWAQELVQLQKKYPEQSRKADKYDIFKDFDGSTGFNLPLDDSWIQNKAQYLIKIRGKVKKPKTDEKIKRKRLF